MHSQRVGAALLALVGTIGCGRSGPFGDERVEDAFRDEISLCGFPASQLAEDAAGRSFGRLRVAQRLQLDITGETGRIQSVSWRARNDYAPHPPVVRLAPSGRFTATLEGVATGGDDPNDHVFVIADLTFLDGSARGVGLAACERGSWTSADRIVVVP